ncbi:anaerobic ribonucleoside triphosphate reductase [Evansella cellulosilytica]|uniref:Anaerobic ribonucleoside-triphosphate reductase n=1 Tax=Evansella cellulosilytica (strain ATCC 21833 / DSM 2522 / FERM P-1141 / JCM 9156 / N-4) TaxID=649639 RepID=E6TY97_EVAC2|nr:anaerobic ribonucleoside triphosphate reductase [Evansella cellulosilytica]ADU32416.1 anaerobic ribonucleoside-triphosphate reductase [Evansella cellulosilytica DSM 2522]
MEELTQVFEKVTMNTAVEGKENANMDGGTPLGKLNQFASTTAKWYTDNYLLTEEARKAEENNEIYIHDKDFYPTGTSTCCQIPLGKLLKNGFHTGHGFIRPPKSIHTAMSLASIILQANQNMQHGGQAYASFDYDLAPYVRVTFEQFRQSVNKNLSEREKDDLAWEKTEEATYQACEAFIHNANTMHSRGGGQVPFVSVNYGTDVSKEGRMIIKQLLLATGAGLGKGETPIFPIQIFKLKDGINSAEHDPNYDLFQLAVETTAKRLFPNFSFLDAPFNKQFDNGTPESEVAYMGCRTRVMGNIHGEETTVGRGNLSFTSLNLPGLALKAKGEIQQFYRLLNSVTNITINQLLHRLEFQSSRQANEFPFLYSQGVWRGGEFLDREEEVKEVLKQGTLSIGFIGLAEALVVLTGKHHGECEEAWSLGKEVISFLRNKMEEAVRQYQLNFSLLATPAEGLSGKFTVRDQKKYGIIERVTDKSYYTNSFHIPVDSRILIEEIIRREAPFHALCNAGHITYIELDGNASANRRAIMQVIELMKEHQIGYGSINHPVDRCHSCGYSGIMANRCPQCESDAIERIRRITGYLVGDLNRWNNAKREEETKRVKHSW